MDGDVEGEDRGMMMMGLQHDQKNGESRAHNGRAEQ